MFQTFEDRSEGAKGPARLTAVRDRLRAAGFDGMVVPRADRHMGETVAPMDERLAWLTGFTGSAGAAVVLPEEAAVFVDGRYTLQAGDQVDGGAFAIVGTEAMGPAQWLRAHAAKGWRVGFDPWLHGRAEVAALREALESAGATLDPLPANPIDEAWDDRPAAPRGAVRPHGAEIAGEDAAAKRARVGEAVREAGAEAAVLTLPDAIAWMLNIRGADLARSPVVLALAIVRADGGVELFADPAKFGDDARRALGNGVTLRPEDDFAAALDGLKGRAVLLDERTCPLWVATRLEDAGAPVVWGRDPVSPLKAVKTEAELRGMRDAHLTDGAAMVRFLAWLDRAAEAGETLTEIDVVTQLEGFRRETGDLLDISFDTICGSGPHGAIVHYRVNEATNRTLVPGEPLLIDSGGQYARGTTDITRTVAFGPPAEDAMRPFTLVLRGMIALSAMRWPEGLTGRDLDPVARIALWQAGLDYDHGTGHGVGAALNVHEGPASISRRGAGTPLRPGMILSNEPGCYRKGRWGIRIENLVAVTPPETPEGGERAMLGFETLTWCPIDRRMIDATLMTAAERAWLDAYHAETRERIAPRLGDDGPARDWLDRATAPLA